jgi:hypothetical protein
MHHANDGDDGVGMHNAWHGSISMMQGSPTQHDIANNCKR